MIVIAVDHISNHQYTQILCLWNWHL